MRPNDTTALSQPDEQAADTCPRCGGGFHCGVKDAGPCPCSTLTLSPALQADLRRRYARCLCLRCLGELAQQDATAVPSSPGSQPG
jgi:hypothetical protein